MLSIPLAFITSLIAMYGYVCRFDQAVDIVVKYMMSGPFLVFFHTASTGLFSRLMPGVILP